MLRNEYCILRFSSISSKEGNEPTPVLWYWILAELQNHFSLKNCSWSKFQTVFTLYHFKNYLPHETIFRRHGIQPDNHSYTASIDMLMFIYSLQLEYFADEIHHGDFLYFHFTRKQQKQQLASFHTVYRVVAPLNCSIYYCRLL